MSAIHLVDAIERRTRLAALLAMVTLCGVGSAAAQSTLTLADAIARARQRNPDVGAAAAAVREATARVGQARGGYFPKVDASESWQRGNDPVFVFGAHLAQRRFTAADFAVDAINHPAAVTNVAAALSVEQALLDPATSGHVRASSIGRDLAITSARLVEQDLTAAVTEAFGRVVVAAATARAAATTVAAARADRDVAGNRRDAGRVTDADVLEVDVYVARTLERQVQASADERVARARLNQLLGDPLTTIYALDLTPAAGDVDTTAPAVLEEEAVRNRPDVALARQQERLAAAMVDAARAAFLPHIAVHGSWGWNGSTWSSRSSSWAVGVVARLNLFHGFADKARLAEAQEQAVRRAIERGKAETMARLDVQVALARLEAARASEAVGRTAAARARESRRIIRDRYESGLTDAAALLRSADALEQADVQQIAARVGVLTATATLNRAMGRP